MPLISNCSMMPAWHQLVSMSGHVEESETARKFQLYATSIYQVHSFVCQLDYNCCLYVHSGKLYSQLSWFIEGQGHSQPDSPEWARAGARVPLSSFLPQILNKFSYFSSNFTYFLPHFGPPGGRVAHPGSSGKALATPLLKAYVWKIS